MFTAFVSIVNAESVTGAGRWSAEEKQRARSVGGADYWIGK